MQEFKTWDAYWRFARNVRQSFRYVRSKDDEEFLNTVLATSEARRTRISAGQVFWRARRGHDYRVEFQDGETEFKVPAAHSPNEMKPTMERAPEGRVNPKGIPYLYLASTKETAMSEVRPWIGSVVSVATFWILRELTVIDCSRFHNQFEWPALDLDAELPPPDRERVVWTHIDRAFSLPTERSDDAAEYVPTQVIAEVFKRAGYDGVVYKSVFGENGYNICLFDLSVANLLTCQLFRVTSVDYKFEEDDNPYYVTAEIERYKTVRKTLGQS